MSDKIAQKLVSYHKLYFRDFIWRHKITPYRIMIAEFMLNRTKAGQVEPIYARFIKKYPDLNALSKANPIAVRSMIKSLGLTWRYRNFKKSAQYIINECSGIFPVSRASLLKIPGIGDYVAGAMLTVCFNKKEYVVDSNIARFIQRYYGLKVRAEMRRQKSVIKIAKKLWNYEKPGKLLFAILDFTALICKPVKPLCYKCMFKNNCDYWKEHKKHNEGCKRS
jgi:A/G-specific adenine glycosylase